MTNSHTIDFIGIGTTKSASTWVFHCLMEHPEISASVIKETRFFDNIFNYRRGLSYYESFFQQGEPGKIRGEFSPSYLYHQETADRITEHFPQVKLIAVFRNPIEKLYSSFWSNKTGGRGSMIPFTTFEQALDGVPSMKESALHGKQLELFLQRFNKDQFYGFLYDDIVNDPVTTIQNVYRFLGVESNYIPRTIHTSVNQTGDRKIIFPIVFKIIYGIYWNIKKYPSLHNMIKKLNTTRYSIALSRMLRKQTNQKIKKPPMDQETRKKLQTFFKKDNELLGIILGRDLSHWN